MTQTALEALNRLAERASNYHDEEDTFGLRASEIWEWKDTIRQALTGAGEPVGWQRRLKFTGVPGGFSLWEACSKTEATGHFERKPGYEYRPIFASPQTPTPDPYTVTVRREDVEEAISLADEEASLWLNKGNNDNYNKYSSLSDRFSQALQVKP